MTALLGITAAGAITSLLFAARAAATFMPADSNTDSADSAAAAEADPDAASAAAAKRNAALAIATLAAFAPLALTKHDPAAFGELMTIPAGLAWSVLGWLAAKDWKAGGGVGAFLLNPVVVGALTANVGVKWHAALAGVDYMSAMHNYLGHVSEGPLLLGSISDVGQCQALMVIIEMQSSKFDCPLLVSRSQCNNGRHYAANVVGSSECAVVLA